MSKFAIHDSRGYFKMHWELFDLLNGDLTLVAFMEYLLAVYKKLREVYIINGEEYRRLSNSFIRERIDLCDATIAKYLDKLQSINLIKVEHFGTKLNGTRYIKLNCEIIKSIEYEIEPEVN